MPLPVYVQWLVPMEHWVISPELAGQKNVLIGEINGVRVLAEFPAPPDPYSWVSVGPNDKPELIGVNNFWLRAHLMSELSSHPTIADERMPTEAEMTEATNVYDRATTSAQEVLTKFVDMAAERHKRFLGRVATPLAAIRLDELFARLYVGDPPQVAKAGRAMTSRAFTHGTERGSLTLAEALEIGSAISAGDQPDLGWQLYGRGHRLLVLDRNYRQGILELAICVEVALDAAYRRVAKGQPFVDIVIEKLRVDEQLKEGAKAVLGVSFSDTNKPDYDRVIELMKRRNLIVHRGDEADLGAHYMKEKLDAVRALLTWLDTF